MRGRCATRRSKRRFPCGMANVTGLVWRPQILGSSRTLKVHASAASGQRDLNIERMALSLFLYKS